MFENFGNIVKKISKINDSITEYKTASKNSGIPSRAFVNWGIFLANSGNIDQAIEKFELACFMARNPENFTNWGIALVKKGKLEDAITKFKTAIQIDPEYARAYSLLGSAMVEIGQIEEAGKKYEIALKLNPRDIETYIGWGIALAKNNKKLLAEDKFKKALAINPKSAQAMYLCGVILAEQEKYIEAIERFESAGKIQPNNPDIFHYWALALTRLEKYEEAMEKAKKVLSINPLKIEAHINLGEILTFMEKYEEAVECYKIAEKINSGIADLHMAWGITLQKYGEHFEALMRLRKALSLQEKKPETMYYLALSLAETGDCPTAIKLLEEVLFIDSRYTDAYTKLGSIYNIMGNSNKALENYLKATKASPHCARTTLLIAHTYNNAGDFDNAIKYYNKTIELNPECTESYISLAVIYSEQENNREAIRKIRIAFRQNPKSSKVNMIYGVILSKEDKFLKDALEKFDAAIKSDPYLTAAYIGKGEVLIRLKKFNESITVLNELLSKNPNEIPAVFMLGVAFTEAADQSKDTFKYNNALECYNKVLKINPAHIESMANIIYVKARLGDLVQFETEFKKLIRNYPEHRDIIYSYLDVSIQKLEYPKNISNFLEK